MKQISNRDVEVKIINKSFPYEFEKAMNELLSSGCWRVQWTEISVTDHHYYAMLIRSDEIIYLPQECNTLPPGDSLL